MLPVMHAEAGGVRKLVSTATRQGDGRPSPLRCASCSHAAHEPSACLPERDSGAIYLSADGSIWESFPVLDGVQVVDTRELRFVVDGPAGFLAFGGVCCREERAALWRSVDGRRWDRLPYPEAGAAAAAYRGTVD